MGIKEAGRSISSDLDAPIQFDWQGGGLFKKKKIHIRIFFEDGSYKDYYCKWPTGNLFIIKRKGYFLVPRAMAKGAKQPYMEFYYDNPWPIEHKYEASTLTALDLRTPEELKVMDEQKKTILAGIILDAAAIHDLSTAHVVKGLYGRGNMSWKGFLIVAVVAIIVILLILHFTHVIKLF